MRSIISLLVVIPCLLGQTYRVEAVAGASHSIDGPGLKTHLRTPLDITAGRDGAFFLSDYDTHRIRRIAPDFTTTTVAGNGLCCFAGDGGVAREARVGNADSIAYDGNRNRLFIAQGDYGRIRAVDLNTGIITTFAGTGVFRYTTANENRAAASATMVPEYLATDPAGNLFVTDPFNRRVYRIDAATGILRTIAGAGNVPYLPDSLNDERPAISLPIDPGTIAASNTHVVFLDRLNHVVVNLATGIVRTLVRNRYAPPGGGEFGGGAATGKPFFTKDSNVLISDVLLRSIRGFTVTNPVDIYNPFVFIAWERANPPLYDLLNSTFADLIRAFAISGGTVLSIGNGRQVSRISAGQMIPVVGAGFPPVTERASDAYLHSPVGLAFNRRRELMIADLGNGKLRILDALGTSLRIPGWIGIETPYTAGRSANSFAVRGVTTGAAGETIMAAGHCLLAATPDEADYSVFAGTCRAGFAGDGGRSDQAQFRDPSAVALLPDGSLLVADHGNLRLRQIAPERRIRTVAGDGTVAFRPGVPPTQTGIAPYDVTVGPDGMAYIADFQNHRVYRFDLARQTIESIAGTGSRGFSGDGGLASQAALNSPTGVAVNRKGEIFIADFGNNRIRRITPGGVIQTVAGTGEEAVSGDGGPARAAAVDPYRLAAGPDDAIYFSDYNHHVIRRLVETGAADVVSILQGNSQNVVVNSAAAQLLRIALRNGAGQPVADAPVTFTSSPGVAILTADVRTNTAGQASARALVTQAGSVTVRAIAGGADAVTFHLTGTAPVGPLPLLSAASVYAAGLTVNALSPLGLGSVFGADFAAEGVERDSSKEDLVEGRLPLVSAGVCVEIGSVRAPLLYVSATRIDFQTPVLVTGVPPGTNVLFQIVRDSGTATERRSAPVAVPVQRVSPELRRSDGATVQAVDAETGEPLVQVRPGQRIKLYATGLGLVEPEVAAGEFAAAEAAVAAPVNVRLAGQLTPGSARLPAGSLGIYTVEFSVPADAVPGDLAIQLAVDGVLSPAGTVLTVSIP